MGDLKRDSEVTFMKKFNGVMSFKRNGYKTNKILSTCRCNE
jgi:hypothetical protein